MHNPAADALAASVVQMRKSAGFNQRELAEALGREQNLVARIETGQRRLDLIDWINICHACGVDPEAEIAKLVRRVLPMVPKRRSRRSK